MAKMLLIERLVVSPRSSLAESSSQGPAYLVENSGGKTRVKLPVTVLEVRNENGRVYSTSVMENAVKKCADDFKMRKLLCTVNDHPKDPYVAPGEASHIVTNAWCENGYLWNEWEVLETHNGKNLKALIAANVAIGVSIRGLGSMDNYGNILEDYEYLGTDCVGQPSAKLWVAPQVVSESMMNSDKGNFSMKTLNDALKYLSEQQILLGAESDKMEAFKRATVVESALAVLPLPPKDLVEIHKKWDSIKSTVFVESPGESIDQLKESIKKLNEKLDLQSKYYRKEIAKLSEQANKATDILKKALKASFKKTVESSSKASHLTKKYQTAIKIAAKSQTRMAESLELATKYKIKYGIAISEAAISDKKYGFAVKEAAALLKKPVAKKAQTEQAVRGVVKVITAPQSADLKKTGAHKSMTEAYQRGEHSVPGFY